MEVLVVGWQLTVEEAAASKRPFVLHGDDQVNAHNAFDRKKAVEDITQAANESKELELELIQTQMTQKPVLRAEVGMRVRCANKTSAECIMRGRGIGQNSRKNRKKRGICG